MGEPLYSCSCAGCRDEVSYPASDLRVHDGAVWCNDCWDYSDPIFITFDENGDGDERLDWLSLEPFVPEHEKRIAELKAENKALREDAAAWSYLANHDSYYIAMTYGEEGTGISPDAVKREAMNAIEPPQE